MEKIQFILACGGVIAFIFAQNWAAMIWAIFAGVLVLQGMHWRKRYEALSQSLKENNNVTKH